MLGVNFRGSTGFGHEFCRAISAKGGVGWNVGGEDTIARLGLGVGLGVRVRVRVRVRVG